MPYRQKKAHSSRRSNRQTNHRSSNRKKPIDETPTLLNKTEEETALSSIAQAESAFRNKTEETVLSSYAQEESADSHETEEETALSNATQAEFAVPKNNYGNYPVKIYSDSLSEVWYKFDVRADMFKSHVNIHYMSPVPLETLQSVVMLDLFEEVLKMLVPKQLNSRYMAGTDYKINPGLTGLWVVGNSLNQKLPMLLNSITMYLAQCSNLLTKDEFNLMKEEKLQAYYKKIMDPFELADDLKKWLTILHYPSKIDMHAALVATEFQQFQEFVKKFTERMYVQFFVQGTMEKNEIIEIAKQCIETLNCRPMLPKTTPQHSVNEIPRGVRCCRVRSFDPEHLHSYMINYYQFDDPSLKLTGMIDYLNMVMLQYFRQDNKFDLSRITFGMFSYDITADGLEDETMEAIESRIEIGRRFINESFKNMTRQDLLYIKTNMIREKKEEIADIGLEQSIDINWIEIMFEKYIFDRAIRELNFMSEMPLEELRAWMLNFTAPEGDYRLRKLSIQVVGYADPMENAIDTREIRDNGKDKTSQFSLKYLTRLSSDSQKITSSTRDYILDIQDFRRGLKALPWQMSSV